MKMNKLFVTSALLLSSLSALGLSANHKETLGFEMGEMQVQKDVLRENPNTQTKPADSPFEPTDEGFVREGTAKNVSKAIAQIKQVDETHKTLRFAAAVNAGLADSDKDGKIEVNDKGQFGFHVSYTVGGKTLNRNVNVNNYYLSLVTPDITYKNAKLSTAIADVTGDMASFATNVLHEPDLNPNSYDSFIVMEIRDIPVDQDKITFEAQPYFISEEEATKGEKTFAQYSKKADITGVETSTIKIGNEEKVMDTEFVHQAKVIFEAPKTWAGIDNVKIHNIKADPVDLGPESLNNQWVATIPVSEKGDSNLDIDFTQWDKDNNKDFTFHATDKGIVDNQQKETDPNSTISLDLIPGNTYKVTIKDYAGIHKDNGDKWFTCTSNLEENAPKVEDKYKHERHYISNVAKETKTEIRDSYGNLVSDYEGNSNAKDGIYTTPADGEYAYYYKYDSKSIWVGQAPVHHEKLYFVPSTKWAEANARFAAYLYGDGNINQWVDFTRIGETTEYECVVPEGKWTHVIICRMNPNNKDNRWNYDNEGNGKPLWAKTEDLQLVIENKFTMTGTEWDTKGEWSSHTESK